MTPTTPLPPADPGGSTGQPPETRHCHGGEWHDHRRGNIPHPPHGNGSIVVPGGAMGLGIALAVIGALLMLWQGNNHAICQSILVQAVAPDQCSGANTVWIGGVLLLVAGVVLFVTTAIVLAIRGSK